MKSALRRIAFLLLFLLLRGDASGISVRLSRSINPGDSEPPVIYVLLTDSLVMVREQSGQGVPTFETVRSQIDPLMFPQGIYVDADRHIYIADTGNSRIVRVDDITGKNWTVFGSSGRGAMHFNQPCSIFLDSRHRIYVADTNNERIARFDDMTGKNWITFGLRERRFWPRSLFINTQDRIYTTDTAGRCILRMDDISGSHLISLSKYPGGGRWIRTPYAIWGDSKGRIYFTDGEESFITIGNIIRVDDMTGKNWTSLSRVSPHRLDHLSSATYGLCLDERGRIYIADTNFQRLVRIDDMTGKNSVTIQLSTPLAVFVR